MTGIRDVVVIGGGTAGSAAALQCARRGMDVLLLERGELDAAGASWVNGVARSAFSEADVPPPTGEELRGDGAPMHLVAGWDGSRLVLRPDVLEVDMRLLVQRLQRLAKTAGAELRGGVTVRGWAEDGVLDTSAGPVPARWVIDASGLKSAGLIERPVVPPEHLCVAAQAVFECTDPEAAEAWFRARGASLGPALVFTGVAGGFSIVNVRSEGDEVAVLTGSIAGSPHPSGTRLLEGFVDEHTWVGRKVFGGARAIPLRRPFDRIADDRVALIGDAASQVFSAHGSGIAAGMVAARMVAEALADGGGPRGYEVRWMRAHGGRFAAYDLFRRFSESLTQADLERLITSGLMDATTSSAVVEQKAPRLTPALVLGKIAGAVRAPAALFKVLPVLLKMRRLGLLYARYPDDAAAVGAWGARVAELFGEAAVDDR